MSNIEEFKGLIINSFPDKICNEAGEYFRADNTDEFYIKCPLSLKTILVNSLNRERIQFALHIFEIIYNQGDTSTFSFESSIQKTDLSGSNKSDFRITTNGKTAYIAENKNFEVGNKFNKDTFDAFRLATLKQLVEKYMRPLSEQGNFGEQFFVSLIIMDPNVFLAKRTNFAFYADDTKNKEPEKSLRDHGVYIETYLINSDILSDDFLEADYIDYFNGATKYYAVPAFVSLDAKPGKVFLDSEHEKGKIFRVNSKLKDMGSLPLFNPAGLNGSQNTRDLDLSPEKRGMDYYGALLETLFIMYYDYNTETVPEDRLDIKLKTGSNPREIGFRSDRSIIFRRETQDNLTIVSLDIALIDGQHSTYTYFDLYNETANAEGDVTKLPKEKQELFKLYTRKFKDFARANGWDLSAVPFTIPKFHDFIGNKVVLTAHFTGSKAQKEIDRLSNSQNTRNEIDRSDAAYNVFKFSLIGISTQYNNDSGATHHIKSKKSFVSHPHIKNAAVDKNLIELRDMLPFFMIPIRLDDADKDFEDGLSTQHSREDAVAEKWYSGLADDQLKLQNIKTPALVDLLEDIDHEDDEENSDRRVTTWSSAGVLEHELVIRAFHYSGKNLGYEKKAYINFIEYAAIKLIDDKVLDMINAFIDTPFNNLYNIHDHLKDLIKRLSKLKGKDRHVMNLINAVIKKQEFVETFLSLSTTFGDDQNSAVIDQVRIDLSNETFIAINTDLLNKLNKKVIYFNKQHEKRNMDSVSFYNNRLTDLNHCCSSAFLRFRENAKTAYSPEEAALSIAEMPFSNWEEVVDTFFDKCQFMEDNDISFEVTSKRSSPEPSRNSTGMVNFNGLNLLNIDMIHYLFNSLTPVNNYDC